MNNYNISFIDFHVVLTILGKMENVKVNIVVNSLNCLKYRNHFSITPKVVRVIKLHNDNVSKSN